MNVSEYLIVLQLPQHQHNSQSSPYDHICPLHPLAVSNSCIHLMEHYYNSHMDETCKKNADDFLAFDVDGNQQEHVDHMRCLLQCWQEHKFQICHLQGSLWYTYIISNESLQISNTE